MSAITTKRPTSKTTSAQPVALGATRHTARGGLMMAILGRPKQVLRQPR